MQQEPLPELIETARLRLRPWALADVEDVLSYARDPEWARYLRLVPMPYSRGDAERFVAGQLLLDRHVHPSWAVVLGETVIGGINLRFSFEHRLGEVGYSVARAHWNQGYATEAAHGVIDRAFAQHTDLNRIRAWADVDNTASQRVMEKLGMVKEGVLRKNRVERGEAIDEAWFGVLRAEWGTRAS
jgi:[ribosomal protein S5]-alanine N-acetyltransferase